MILKAFLSKLSPKKRESFEQFLPEAERMRMESLPDISQSITDETLATEDMLNKVHWSWFLPTLKACSWEEQKFFLSSLSPQAAQNLARVLETAATSTEIPKIGREYLRSVLVNSLLGPNDRLLPPAYLPESPLLPLLNLNKSKLKQLIDYLALYDLANEVRQIVETKILKKIYSHLTEDERLFLKGIQAHKEPLPRMLDRWDGEKETFRTLLHKRGLARLGAALSGQNPDFVWYVCHQLDIGRGNALFKLVAKQEIPEITENIIRQIEEVLAKL
jgi:hypothetical protein